MTAMAKPRTFSAFGVSVVVHAALLSAMWMIKINLIDEPPDIAVESIFDENRTPQEITQELDPNTDLAESMSAVSGGVVSTTAGTSNAQPKAQVRVETSQQLKDPVLTVNPGTISIPGDDTLDQDLGKGQTKGEVGAVVDGYGAALHRITQELRRLMRVEKVLVVWLFDESESMKDDQAEIRKNFHKVYEDLGLVERKDAAVRKKGGDVLLTAVVGFGSGYHPLTRKPTADVKEIRAAITRIPIDTTGREDMCRAVATSIDRYHRMAARSKRKLAIIVVSDESGDDGKFLEPTIDKARRAKSPVYILGRESIFGYPYARIRWKDPKYGLWHWVRINRGPETVLPECLQWDGLHSRWDNSNAGFGPYVQVRLARESNGIFFVLPGEEENLSGRAALNERRKFRFLDMKEYQPLLLSEREYVTRRGRSKFRTQIWNVIRRLNPYLDKQLNIRELYYSIEPAKFRSEAAGEFSKAVRAMQLDNEAIRILEKIGPLRAKEDSQRWRAAYDLAYAQVLSYRVRLFQYLLALDQHAKKAPRPKKKSSNVWNVGRHPAMLPPDPQEVKKTKVNIDELKNQEVKARNLYQFVIKEHPGTPWARRAAYELSHGFGMFFYESFRDPKYDRKDIKIPNF